METVDTIILSGNKHIFQYFLNYYISTRPSDLKYAWLKLFERLFIKSCCSLNDVENLDENIGAKDHLLMNGGLAGPREIPKEYEQQVSKETQISGVVSDSDEYFSDDDRRERHCIWRFNIVAMVKNIYFLFLENIYRVAGQQDCG